MDSTFELSSEVYRNEPVEEIEYIKRNSGRWYTENGFLCFRYPSGKFVRNLKYGFYNGKMVWQNVSDDRDFRQFKRTN